MAELTPKQQRFVEEYLVDLNATQAAIRAGYAKRTANREGTRLLSNAVIKAAIDEALQKRAAKVELKAEDLLRELKSIAMAPLDGVINVHTKLRALELGMKHLGMLDKKVNHQIGGPIQVITNIPGAPGSRVSKRT